MPILLRVLLVIALTVLTGWAVPHAHASAHSKPHAALDHGAVDKGAQSDLHGALGGCLHLSSDCGAGEFSHAMNWTTSAHPPTVISLAFRDSVEREGVLPEFEPPPPRS